MPPQDSVGKLRFQPGGTVNLRENVEVKESKAPNWARYNVIGRGGTLFAYTGSNSRKFSLDFHMTEMVYGDLTYPLNKIRSASLGQNGSPIPLIKFTYGAQWSAIRCVLTNYSIQNVEKAGYTADGSPRRVSVSLSLEEVDIPQFY